jgi:surface antigen
VHVPAHRRETAADRGWRLPAAVLVALAALLLPLSTAVAVPGPSGTPQQGAQQEKPGAKGPQEKPEPVWTGVPGTNLAHDTYGYPWPAAPDCDESNVASGGCVNDGVGFFQGQCTSWVAYRLGQRNGIAFTNWYEGRHWGNASEWSRVAKGLDHISNKVPAVGAVGWYARGHVSYVEEVNADGSVVISEMNTDGHNGFVVHTVHPGESSWPDRFLHLADVVPVDLTPPGRPAPVRATTTEAGVAVDWKAPADDVGVTGYRVLRNGMPLAETTAPSYVDRQASPGQAYTYSVVAHDEAGNVSEPAATVLRQRVPAPPRQQRPFVPGSATSVAAGDSTAVCGRLGTVLDQRVGCRLRTLAGWRTVRTGRHVPWGVEETRTFGSGEDGLIWYCRVLPGDTPANACLPLDVATQSWGFDRVAHRRAQPQHATWVTSAPRPTRCGMLGERIGCSVLGADGWRTSVVTLRPGDPLSRAFVGTERGTAFCRTVEGHAACTELHARRLTWGRTRLSRATLPHGRWVSRAAGPSLCLPGAGCRPIGPTKG